MSRFQRSFIQSILLLTFACSAAVPIGAVEMPLAIGETLNEVLDRLGDRATFGTDCGTWSGPSIDTDLQFGDRQVKVMGLLARNRIAALRIEQRLKSAQDYQACDAELEEFAAQFRPSAYSPPQNQRSDFDGSIHRTVRSALHNSTIVGFFEAAFRPSRSECKLALVLTTPISQLHNQ